MKIYYNGNIITMDDSNPSVEAVMVKEGIIQFAGSLDSAKSLAKDDAELIDLNGRTLMPAFIDPHSHMMATFQLATMLDLSPVPAGDIACIDDIKEKIRNMINTQQIPAGEVIMAKGYDDTSLSDGRPLNRHDLDEVTTEHKIYIMHCSLHKAVVNTPVLKTLEIDENTKDPVGGIIGREEGSNYPNGILEETAHFQAGDKLGSPPSIETLTKMFEDGQDYYASYGVTTVQEGGLSPQFTMLLKNMSNAGLLKLDVVGYDMIATIKEVEKTVEEVENRGKYINHYRNGGVKLLLDGSPQAKTAWLSEPYYIPPVGQSEDYCGYPTIPDNEVCTGIFEAVINNKLQVLVHTNGDQASEQFLDCYEEALKRTGIKDDLRPVMIHAQTVRDDQLDRMEVIKMIPSFFCMHTYFWGDLHLNSSLGEKRAHRISPTGSVVRRNMPFTIHTDSPVLPPDMMLNVWTAVNRQSRDGVILGKDQKISVYDALKAITIYAAYQYHEEDSKGSISEGKRGDLIILDRNPLDVDPKELKDVLVMETIKDGKTIFIR